MEHGKQVLCSVLREGPLELNKGMDVNLASVGTNFLDPSHRSVQEAAKESAIYHQIMPNAGTRIQDYLLEMSCIIAGFQHPIIETHLPIRKFGTKPRPKGDKPVLGLWHKARHCHGMVQLCGSGNESSLS
jgi:hypothetical protein